MVLRWIRGRLLNLFHIINLNSSCEEFSGPKRMSRGTHLRTSQSGSPRDLAHVNKLSILAPDDEPPKNCCASNFTSKFQCQPRRCGDERVDECIAPETKVSSQRVSGPSKLSAHQVSYFAASGGESRGVHHVREE